MNACKEVKEALRVIIVDKDHLYAKKLTMYLQETGWYIEFSHIKQGLVAVDIIPKLQPQIVLVDLDLPDISGVGFIRMLRERGFMGEIVVITDQTDDYHIFEAFSGGAVGYLLKNVVCATDISNAIKDVLSGGVPMSDGLIRRVVGKMYQKRSQPRENMGGNISQREREILYMLSKGCSSKEISRSLSISYHTVRTHQKNLYKKLNVNSIGEAIAKYKNIE